MEQILEFTNNHPLLTLGLMASFFLLVFSEIRRKTTALISVDASAAVGLINNDANIIDLRSADAFGRGHIVNARNIPFDEFDAGNEKVTALQGKPVLAVCDAGMTSNKAVDALKKSGFENVYSLRGGMNAWSQAGLPVVTGKKTKSKPKK